MDGTHFDRLTRSLADRPSRRGLLRGLAAALALATVRNLGLVEARNKHKTKGAKGLRRNAFGCVATGKACRGNDANCCSGICQGKKPKKGKEDTSKCVAHNVLECQAGQDSCPGEPIPCGAAGACTITTGKASFCSAAGDGDCVACRTDADCEASRGPGAACIVCPGNCPETATACFAAGA
jgi:hypothetical protein